MIIGVQRYIDARIADLSAHWTAVREADATSVVLAREEMTRRLEGMNEFREALADQTAHFVPRPEVEEAARRITSRLEELSAEHRQFVGRPEHDALADRIGALEVRVTRTEGTDTGAQSRTASLRQTIVVSVAILSLVMTVIIALLDHYVSR